MKTEITVQVFNDKDDICALMKEKGFEIKETFTLTDRYFSVLSILELQSFSYPDIIKSSILLRQIDNDAFLVYKQKILDSNGVVLQEEKIKTKVDSFENTSLIMKNSGLTLWCEMINRSVVFNKGETELVLQEVNGLGRFIEFEEYPSISSLSPQEKIDILTQEIKSLGLRLGQDLSYKKPYEYFKTLFK